MALAEALTTDGYDMDVILLRLREIGVVDGETYGVPYYNYALGLIVRPDIL